MSAGGRRTVDEIAEAIAVLDERRRALSDEYDAAVAERESMMLRWFDDGGSFNQIAVLTGLHYTTVKQFLWNHGRTVGGRDALRARLAASGAPFPAILA